MFDGVYIVNWVTAWLHRGAVENMNEHTAPLHMAQKLQPQTFAFTGTGYQPRNVSDGIDNFTRRNDSEIWNQSGERVVGNFWPSRTHGGNEA